jgi:putative SOS response-associated peptidase YedK
MCTAQEIGKRGGSFPEFVKTRSIAEILGLDAVQPTDLGLVIMPDGELRTMKWGFRRPFKGKLKKTVWRTIVNTREDNLDSGTWREAIAERRCIVPVGLAYEWNSEKGHQRTFGMERPNDGYMGSLESGKRARTACATAL